MPRPEREPEHAAYKHKSRIGEQSTNLWIRRSAEIDGWIFEGEHEYLWKLATGSAEGDILEIGTWMGKSTCILAGACIERAPNTKVLCIDPFDLSGAGGQAEYHKRLLPGKTDTLQVFLSNARKLGFRDWVMPIVARSEVALPLLTMQARLVFIDGNHDLRSIQRDVQLSLPLIAEGGVLAIHDVSPSWPDVERYAKTLSGNRILREMEIVNSLAAFEKVAQ